MQGENSISVRVLDVILHQCLGDHLSDLGSNPKHHSGVNSCQSVPRVRRHEIDLRLNRYYS